jgi:MFS transporter, MHS family, proline/betaine transporter
MGLFSSLNREQKEAIGLLQVGTFLEYFDLMLYIHMAVLLNDIFFPKTDPHTAALLTALAFCSTYVMRPIGALIFGWLGDNFGRKSTIIITTVMMAMSCILMANLPTYAQIGISAAWIVTICRIIQGMSSMGEIIGAQIYVTESITRPLSYPAVALVSMASGLGATAALGIATLVTSYFMNWRLAFWIGTGIALVGAVARTRLRETPDFLEMKRQQMQAAILLLNTEDALDGKKNTTSHNTYWKEPIAIKTIVSYFLIFCGWPLTFYLAYMCFNPMLKDAFGYTSEEVIKHNFFLSFVPIVSSLLWISLCCYIHPLKLMKVRGIFAIILLIAMPFLILKFSSGLHIFLFQSSLLTFHLGSLPGEAVFNYHLPIYRRFTFASFLYALSRALMYIITSFGLVFLGNYIGTFGFWIITLPIGFAFLYGIRHFESLEKKLGIYPYQASQGTKQVRLKSSPKISLYIKKRERRQHA